MEITAKEFITKNGDMDFRLSQSGEYISKLMIEFAKLHAVQILKKLSKTENEYQRNIKYIYPLTNIK